MTARFTLDSPQVLKCKEAGARLRDHLFSTVMMTGVGVGLNADGDGPAIYLYIRNKRDRKLVPDTFEGYEVVVQVTGDIVPL